MTSVSNVFPCLVSLSYLGAIYWSFEYHILGKKNILLGPCKKAVTWSCEIEISYMTRQPILHGQRWEKMSSIVGVM